MVVPNKSNRTQRDRSWKGRFVVVIVVVVFVALLRQTHDYSILAPDLSTLSSLLEEKNRSEELTASLPPFTKLHEGGVSNRQRHQTPQDDEGKPFGSSIQVVQEKDIAVDYSGRTEFQAKYFKEAPACSPIDPENVSFTLVTQASLDRLWILQHHCQRWPAPRPISIAVYLPPPDDTTTAETTTEVTPESIARQLDEDFQCDTSRMTVTLLRGNSPMDRYPVNMLRNLAIRKVRTSHFFYTDSDFLISDGLYDELMTSAPLMASDPKAAMVVPAFVYLSACGKAESTNATALECMKKEGLPYSKKDLLPMWAKFRQEWPRVKQGFHGVHFHGSTLYSEFKTQNDTIPLPCITSYLYEPYLAVRLCRDLPEFPEVFRGYGWNKNVWVMWLTRKLPYRLWQSPRGFVFHVPHKVSASWKSLKKADPTTGKVKETPPEHDAYLKWFKQLPNHPDRIETCPKSKNKK